jgi:hemerythrin-like domain-containing protein
MKMFFIKDKVKKLIQQVLYIQSSTTHILLEKKILPSIFNIINSLYEETKNRVIKNMA